MRRIASLSLLVLAAGCATLGEFDPASRTVSPESEEPVTLGPGVYRIPLPRTQPAMLRAEGCGALWIDTVSQDSNTLVNTLVYGPEPRLGFSVNLTNRTQLANSTIVCDGSNTYFYLSGSTNTFLILNDSLDGTGQTRKYRLERSPDGNYRLKELPRS